jgi:hypothetical protein
VGFLKRPSGGPKAKRDELVRDMCALYSVQFTLDRGYEPPAERLLAWKMKLDQLGDEELAKLVGDREALKGFLG